MPDPTNDIDELLRDLTPPNGYRTVLLSRDECDDHRAAVLALVAERDALKQRVAELKPQPSSDFRERDEAMTRWMDQVTAMLCHSMTHSHDAKQELVTLCDAAIAAMQKEGGGA